MRWDWVSTSPFRGITLNQEGEGRLRWLTDHEEAQLLASCPFWLQDLIAIGVDTGLRRSNLVHLQRSWVQQHGTVLIVPRQHLKARKATVLIPLTTRAAAIIWQQSAATASGYVFTQSDGRPYTLDQVGVAVRRAARRAGLADVSLHTLRHTFISRLVQAGRPLPEVAALAGHRDIKMTLRYAHLAPDHLREGIAALEAYGTRHKPYPQRSVSRCGHAEKVKSA
jgi:integrase